MMLRKLGVFVGLCSVVSLACATKDEQKTGQPVEQDSGGADTDDTPQTDDGQEPSDAGTPPVDASADDEDSGSGFVANANEGGVDIVVPDAGQTFSVSGTLKVGKTLYTDTDTANVDNIRIRNDSVDPDDPSQDTSQLISSPSTVGGYIGPIPKLDADGEPIQIGEDDDGIPIYETIPDDVDYYRVTLAAGQAVTLFRAEASKPSTPLADLDLFLLDIKTKEIVEDSQGAGDKEQVVAKTTNTYWVAVQRYDEMGEPPDGQAIYSLAVGITQPSATQMSINSQRLSENWDAVPFEVVVAPSFGPQSAELAQLVKPINPVDETGYQLMRIDDGSPILPQGGSAARQSLMAIKKLRKMSGLASVWPNYRYQRLGAPVVDDPLLSSQWHYDQIDLAPAWAASDLTANGKRGQGVVVAVLDTGVALGHPDFVNGDGSSQLTDTGFDLISDLDVAADGDGPDNNPDDPGDGRSQGDSSFHGTHCAGTIAAATNNGVGAAGVAPNAKIMPVRVLGRGGGTLEDIRQGVLYAAGLDNSTGEKPSRKADIISMSLGGPGVSDAMTAAVAAANAEGVIVIAAAGNSNAPADFFSPAGVPGVITVSATDFNREKAFYSNFGNGTGVVDVAAPGGDTGADANLDGQPDGVVSLVFKNNGNTQYASYQGTSMACPHVAGVAALMKSIWPEMGPQQFRQALPSITIDIGDEGEDPVFGHGLINANLAVAFAMEQAGEEVSTDPVLSLSTTVLDFGGDLTSMPLAIGNTGQGTLEITAVTPSEPWVLLDAGGLEEGTNTISVQRNALSEGVNTASITVESNGGTQVISVRVFVGEEPTGGDIGLVYVLLVDPTSGDQMAQTATALDVGYAFELEDVPAGKYYLVAGTDQRDTFFLGNDGDAYGAFPVAQDPQLICRFQPEDDPECPQLTDAEKADPNLTGVTIPIQYLLDLGAEQEETEDVSDADGGVTVSGFSVAMTPTKRPMRIRRAKLERHH